MAQRTSYKQGTPCWTDLQTSDLDAAKAFYGGLLGWTFTDMPMESGVYSMATLGSDTVAAIGSQQSAPDGSSTAPAWSTYLAVDSADDAVAAVTANGGTVLMPAADVPDAGRMAFVADPSGAAVGLWQAGQHIGATRVNEPGTLLWNELTSTDNAAALPFYKAVADIDAVQTKMGDFDYTLLKVDGEDVGGAIEPMMDGVPNHWHTWFAVADVDACAAAATAAGGTLLVEPTDMPIGKVATIRDPQGAVFSVMKLAE